jgi:hypothetical protein
MPGPSTFRTYRVGPKNKRLPDASGTEQSSAYRVQVDLSLPLEDLLARNAIQIDPEARLITPENFPFAAAAAAETEMELFDFSFRSDYGRSGVDEAFIRDKLALFKYRAATLPELICFGGHLRDLYRDQWFEAKTIIALGSVLDVTEVVQQKGWFRKEILAHRRNYPELECVAGRPFDLLRLSTTERDRDGNWPNQTLFLAVPSAA